MTLPHVLPIIQEHAGSGSYAQPALAVDAIQAALVTRITDDVTRAEQQISGREDVLDAALSLAELRRVLQDFEPAAEIVETAWERINQNETTGLTLLEQATSLDRAAVLASERKWSEAAEQSTNR